MRCRFVAMWVTALVVMLSAPAGAVDRLNLMLDWFPNIDHLPIYVAQQQGIFDARGLAVTVISPSDTADALKLAASGHVDVAVSYEPQTIIAAAGGLRVQVIGRLVGHPLTTLMYLPKSGIRTPADLEGRRIGYTVPGLMDALLAAFAAVNGINSYEAVNVGFAIAQSLTAGRVDAVMGPFKTYETVTLRQKGIESAYFELERYGIPDYDELVFVAGPGAIRTRGDALRRFAACIHAAIGSIRSDADRALADYFKALPDADRQIETDAFELTAPYFADTQRIDLKRWQRFADFARRHHLVEQPVDVRSLMAPHLLQPQP